MPINIEHLYHTYDLNLPSKQEALKDINYIFEDHCFTALIGQTGSGKSTLIQHLNGLLVPTSGKLTINDYTIDISLVYKNKKGKMIVDERAMKKKRKAKLKDIKTLRKRVGLVFQFPEYQLFEDTVIKDVSYGPKNFGMSDQDALEASKAALNLVGIDSSYYERSPFELSGGEKRRVAIAGIIAMKPDILVLDEPTVGLDASGEELLLSLINNIYEQNTSLIIATHNMDIVLKCCKKAIVLDKGRIVKSGTPLELFQDESFLASSSLEPPKVISFALELKKRGLPINLDAVKDVKSLAREIIRARGERR